MSYPRKFSPAIVRAIRAAYAALPVHPDSGYRKGTKALCERYSVSNAALHKIVRRETYVEVAA